MNLYLDVKRYYEILLNHRKTILIQRTPQGGVTASFIHMIGFDVKMSTGHRDNKGSNQDIQILMLIVK